MKYNMYYKVDEKDFRLMERSIDIPEEGGIKWICCGFDALQPRKTVHFCPCGMSMITGT